MTEPRTATADLPRAGPTTHALISAHGLKKTYGSGPAAFHALRGVDLDVRPAEKLAIVGKSGSGKSTLMHLLALLDSPSAGTLEVMGQDARTLTAAAVNGIRNRAFGFVFQQFFMIPNASVLENVELPLKIGGVAAQERRLRALAVLEQVEMADKANNRATDLSGGQKQRMVIARAIVNEPRVVFADEPTGNLDTATGRIIEDLLFGLNESAGITLVIVTHDEDLASRCSRQVSLKDGLIVDPEVAA